MSANTNAPATTTPAKRASLVLAKPIRNTLEGSTLVQAKRSPQVHVLLAGAKLTLCRIDTSRWNERVDVAGDAKVSCPVCGAAMKAATAKAAEQHITEPAPAKPRRRRKPKAETAKSQTTDVAAS